LSRAFARIVILPDLSRLRALCASAGLCLIRCCVGAARVLRRFFDLLMQMRRHQLTTRALHFRDSERSLAMARIISMSGVVDSVRQEIPDKFLAAHAIALAISLKKKSRVARNSTRRRDPLK